MFKKIFFFILELSKIVVVSLAIIIPVRYFLIQPFYVNGKSMEPNFHDREYLIIDELSYRFNAPERGDIIVFRYPKDPQEYFIKRLIGLPGEEIQIKEGNIIIYNSNSQNGFILEEEYLDGVKTYSSSAEKIKLGENEYYVLGDNRNSSKDSRSFGSVNKSFIVGRVFFRGFPVDEMKVFTTPEYGN
ncbi:MAG: signal peptidase I [bacterium]